MVHYLTFLKKSIVSEDFVELLNSLKKPFMNTNNEKLEVVTFEGFFKENMSKCKKVEVDFDECNLFSLII